MGNPATNKLPGGLFYIEKCIMHINMQEIITNSPEETQSLASSVALALSAKKGVRGTATIVALQGNLGAGKTVFVKGIAKSLGIEDDVTSPTFVIEKLYELPENASWNKLIHIDAYRLEGEDELNTIDWNNIATDPNNLIMIEWPEQVGLGVPERAVWIEFGVVDEKTRKIKMPDNIEL